jgi:hypothetical protein
MLMLTSKSKQLRNSYDKLLQNTVVQAQQQQQ